MASSEDPQRSSAGSGSGTGRPAQQLSTIEKSVTHLLVATKQLLETLTLWSRQSASESEVSDVYVRLGYEFNIACRAFNSIGVETSDLGPVPDLLRGILEDTLSQEASQQALDKYLPRIRDIIIGLLHGLKKKQQRLRQKGNTGTTASGSAASSTGNGGLDGGKATRQNSTASNLSVESSLTQQLEDGMAGAPSRHSSSRSFAQRQGSGDLGSGPDFLPPRSSSTATGTTEKRISPQRRQLSPHNSVHATSSRETMTSGPDFGSSQNSTQSQQQQTTMQIPTIAPYPETDTIPTNNQPYTHEYQSQPQAGQLYPPGVPSPEEGPPPRPPPKQNDALTALQRGGDLERRASRRFSAYQIQKHLGGTGIMGGMGAIPAAQHSPVPNRGRDVRESMSAVRARGTVRGDGRARSRVEKPAGSPGFATANDVLSRRISEADEGAAELDAQPTPPPVRGGFGGEGDDGFGVDSPIVKTPEDKLGAYPFPVEGQREAGSSGGGVGATLNGPMEDVVMPDENSYTPVEPKRAELESAPQVNGDFQHQQQQQQHAAPTLSRATSRAVRYDTPPPNHTAQYTPASNEGSPQPGKELTLFLQYKSRIKKYVLDGGELSVPRLQLAFIEKFAWNTQENGVDLPEIYIQDPVSGVRYELDGLQDVRDRSVLVLNVEALDEVKRHIDDGIGGLRRMVEGLRVGMEEQKGALGLVTERQQEAAKTLAGVVAAPIAAVVSAPVSRSASGHMRNVSTKQAGGQLEEVRSLRRDLAVVRQTYGAFVADIEGSMASIKTKAVSVKKAAATVAAVPALDTGGNNNAGRAHVDKGKKSLSEDSEKIVNRVDDLQDVVEDLRKDVVLRGVRPLPRQLETVSKDISLATSELKKLQEYLRKEKPVWTKIWERELQVVCDERELLTMQEELVMDLEDDLEKAAVTFALVEEATRQQNLVANPGEVAGRVASGGGVLTPGGSRSSSRTLRSVGVADPTKAHDGVLGEVRALQPNHESRLEAIERAEKMRQRELEDRKGGEFQRELGSFVEDGRLKKSGGVEEVERLRKAREEKTRREVWETTQARERARAEKEAAKNAPPVVETPAVTNGVPEVPTVENYEGTRESSPELLWRLRRTLGLRMILMGLR
ncbi:Bud site selection protein 6 [Elasticomyces elasticus]|nr:Bud site selection protein 6 [Elasticomyces elasticus]